MERELLGGQDRLAGVPAAATRYGPFLFISSQTAVDPFTGRLASGPSAEWPELRKTASPTSIASPAHYSMALQAGQLVWLAGQLAADLRTSQIVESLEELPPEGQVLVSGNRHLDRREGPALA